MGRASDESSLLVWTCDSVVARTALVLASALALVLVLTVDDKDSCSWPASSSVARAEGVLVSVNPTVGGGAVPSKKTIGIPPFS